MKVYKVVRVYRGERYSAVVGCSPWCTQYILHKEITSEEGACFLAFNTLENAEHFRNKERDSSTREIWECEAEVGESHCLRYLSSLYGATNIHDFLRSKTIESVPPPKGTVFCKKIRLNKLVMTEKIWDF